MLTEKLGDKCIGVLILISMVPLALHIQHFQRFSLADKESSFVDEVTLTSILNVRPKDPPASGTRVQRTLPQTGSRNLNR